MSPPVDPQKPLNELVPGDIVVFEGFTGSAFLPVERVTPKFIFIRGYYHRFNRETGAGAKGEAARIRTLSPEDIIRCEKEQYVNRLTHLKRKDLMEFSIDSLKQLCEMLKV